MDVEYMQQVVDSEHRFNLEHNLVKTDLMGLVCALKVSSYTAMQCFTTVNEEKTVPHIVHGASLIYGFSLANRWTTEIQPMPERMPMGTWLLSFDNLLNTLVPPLCEGKDSLAINYLRQLYCAQLSAAYQYGARLRPGYEA